MSVLKANLKLYYQHRSLWFWYAILVALFFLSLSLASFQDFFILVFFIGALAADSQRDVLTKPFSFLLPGHHEIRRRLLVGLGCALSLFMATGFVVVHSFQFPMLVLYFLASASVALAFYLGGVFQGLSRFASVMVVPWMIFLAPLSQLHYRTVIERIITLFPLWLILAGIFILRCSWKWLGDRSFERKLCGRLIMGIGDSFNQDKMMKYIREKSLIRKRIGPVEPVADWFVSRIRTAVPYGKTRYVIGSFYARFGAALTPYLLVFPLIIIGFSIFLGYAPDDQYFYLILQFYGLLIGISQSNLAPHPTLLVSGGRAEKFYAAALMGFFVTLLILLFFLLAVMLTGPLASLMPAIVFRGRTHPFHIVYVRNQNIYLLAAVLPIGMIFGTMFQKKNVTGVIVVMALAASLLIIFFRNLLAPLAFPATIYGKLNLIAATWTSCLIALYYHFRKRNLV